MYIYLCVCVCVCVCVYNPLLAQLCNLDPIGAKLLQPYVPYVQGNPFPLFFL